MTGPFGGGAAVTSIDPAGLAFIAGWEGGQSSDGLYRAYWDSAGGVWTIGIGETEGVHQGMIWTAAQAHADLQRRLAAEYEPAIRAMDVPFNQNEWNAWCDIAWNLGAGSTKWDIGRLCQAGEFTAAANAMLEYDRAQGVVLSDLARRRAGDRALFLTREAAPVDPRHYPRYVDSPFTRTVNGRPQKVIEQTACREYDEKRKAPHLHELALHELRGQMTFLHKRLWYVCTHDTKTGRPLSMDQSSRAWAEAGAWRLYRYPRLAARADGASVTD